MVDIADARASPLGDFPVMQVGLDALDNRMKELDKNFHALKSYDALSSSVAGSYCSLENRISVNFDPDVFARVWDGIQFVKDKCGNLETVARGNHKLTRDRYARISNDVEGLSQPIGQDI